MLVTTVYEPSSQAVLRAQYLAEQLRVSYAPRGTNSLAALRTKYGRMGLLAVSEHQLRYYPIDSKESQPLTFHPSMAAVRLKRLNKGESDTMLQISGVTAGDAVLDCTAGMASDAIVFAHAVGEGGEVTALESEPIMALIVREGLTHYTSDIPGLNEAMRRVLLIQAHHLDVLRSMPSERYDVVYFDPMFRKPVEDSNWLSPVRQVANFQSISEETIREAVRVARKCVLLKEHRDSGEFARLGFTVERRTGGNIRYGVIRR